MDYELVKQLKDSGFPQIPVTHYVVDKDNADVAIRIPTLSELIEAIGNEFNAMGCNYGRRQKLWWAQSNRLAKEDQESNGVCLRSSGSTPEEAVAKLWLALNE